MPVSSVLAFWVIALLLIAVPGADWAFTISAGLRGRSVVPAVGGLVLGYAAVTLVVAAGVGALVTGSPNILTGLTIVGGAYLMGHGAMTVRRPSTPSNDMGAALPHPRRCPPRDRRKRTRRSKCPSATPGRAYRCPLGVSVLSCLRLAVASWLGAPHTSCWGCRSSSPGH